MLHEELCASINLLGFSSQTDPAAQTGLHGSTEHGTRGDITFCSKRGLSAPAALATERAEAERSGRLSSAFSDLPTTKKGESLLSSGIQLRGKLSTFLQ